MTCNLLHLFLPIVMANLDPHLEALLGQAMLVTRDDCSKDTKPPGILLLSCLYYSTHPTVGCTA